MKNYFLATALISIALFLGDNNLYSQPNIGFGPFDTNPTWIQHLDCTTPNGSGRFQIGMSNPTTGPYSFHWNVCVRQDGMSCTGSQTEIVGNETLAILGLTFNLSGADNAGIMTVFTDGSNLVDRIYDVRINIQARNASNQSVSEQFRDYKIYVRKPRDLVFVLDRSGSMECPTSTSWTNCDVTSPSCRWSILKDAVDNFMKKMDAPQNLLSDRMSVVYFSDVTLNDPALLTHDGNPFRPILNFQGSGLHTNLYNEMSLPPVSTPQLGGSTSIGAGLKKAFDRFTASPNSNSKKSIYLFTDGEQNTGKWVVASAGNASKVIQNGEFNTTVDIDMQDLAHRDIIKYTSALILPSTGATLVANIANSGNYTNVLAGDEVSVALDFATNAFNKIYEKYSPQLIRYDKQTLAPAGSVSSTFNCNKDVNRVIFEAYFDKPIGQRIKYRVLKDGIDVTSKGTPLSTGGHIRSVAFNMYNIRDLKSEGKWTFEVLGNFDSVSVKTRLFATADDHKVRFEGKLANDKVRVKDVIKPIATIFELGRGVTNATIKAVILKPGDDIGDILARTLVNVPPPINPKNYSNCGDRKYDYLQATNPAVFAQLKNIQSSTITLAHQGNGVYSGSYNDVNVSGTYKIQYIVNYTSPTLGEVERLIEQTVNVTFPELDWEASAIKQKYKKGTPGENNSSSLTATIRPTFTVNGKTRNVGPGFGNALSVNNRNVRLSNVTDNCDGSYELALRGSLNQRIDLYLTDKVIYSGRAIDLTTGARGLGLSAHAGLAIPTNNFTNSVNTGYYGELDATWRFNSRISIDAVGGYYAFSPNYNILAGTVNIVGQIHISNNWEWHLGLGGGYYKPQSLTAKLGSVGRMSIGKLIKNRYFVSLDLAKHQVKDYDIDFIAAGLGLKFYF